MEIVFSKTAEKDWRKILQHKALAANANKLLQILERNPFEPPYEKLVGKLRNCYSRRINRQHRLVYEITNNQIVILSMWSHYENV